MLADVMKRSWFSVLIVSGVVGLLTLFLGLQFRWLHEVSHAEGERMHKRAETDAHRLAEDFNREMQGAYYNFQIGSDMWKNSDWNEFNQRYDFWKERTSYPELIREIYFLGKADDATILKYEPAKRAFEPSGSNEVLDSLRARLATENDVRPFYQEGYALVAPVYEDEKQVDHIVLRRTPGSGPQFMKMPAKLGWVAVVLDDSVIKQRILPDLATKYFPEGDYKVAVVDESEQVVFATQTVTEPNVRIPIFSMAPDNLVFFGKHAALPRTPGEKKTDVVINQRVESHTMSRIESTETPKGGQVFEFKMKEDGGGSIPRIATMTAGPGGPSEPWMLQVQHTAGSIDAFVRGERNKNFAIGLGLYVLLVGAILAIILSAMRSKRFAQRQIDFVSSVSHEFRTPLAVIYSAGENLADGVAKEDAQVARYGELIKGEGKKLSGMVEQILEFAGVNSGKRNFNFAATDVRDLVSDALKECQPLIESGGFTVEQEVQADLPTVSADRAAMSSAIQNLIANSLKYSNGSKWIRVSAVNGGGSVKIVVEDRGIGIAGDELRQIFEPFYRGKEVVDSQISGNGLGLNQVQKIVDAHGGRVTAESKPGKGSTFTIELPV